jgi:DNA-binding NarL/FixJ family response regulator
MEMTEEDAELICLVAFGLTDEEISTRLRVPKQMASDHVARLLGKLGARKRLELLLYAYSEPTLYHRITAKTANKDTTKTGRMELGF